MTRLSLSMIACLGLVALATLATAETVTVRKVDFPLPLGLAEALPEGVPVSETYVTDDACYYYRKDGAFHFLGCVG